MVRDQMIVGGYSLRHFKQSEEKLVNALAKEGISVKDKMKEYQV